MSLRKSLLAALRYDSLQKAEKAKLGEGVHDIYKERAAKGGDILWYATVKGQKELTPGIPLHMSLKVFEDKKDMDLDKIKEKIKKFDIKTPKPEKLNFKTTIFTSERDGKKYYMLLISGTDKTYSDFYEAFKHTGTVYKKFMPHITIDKGLYDKINKEGLKPEEITFSDLSIEAGAGNTIHSFEKSEGLNKSENASIPTAHIPVHHNEFHQHLGNAITNNSKVKEFVHHYQPHEYSKMKTFLHPDKKSGFAVKPDGDIVSVFSTEKGRGDQIVQHAVKAGGNKLDAFDGYLPKLYAKHGFKETHREKNWTPGGPDVVYMKLHHNDIKKSEESSIIKNKYNEKLNKSEKQINPGDYGNVKPHIGHKEMKNMGRNYKTLDFHPKQSILHRKHSEAAKTKGDHNLSEKHAKMAQMHDHYDTANHFGPHSTEHYNDRRNALKEHTDKAKKLHIELSKSEFFQKSEALFSIIVKETISLNPDLFEHKKALRLNGEDFTHYLQDNPDLKEIALKKHEDRAKHHFGDDLILINVALKKGIQEAYKAKRGK